MEPDRHSDDNRKDEQDWYPDGIRKQPARSGRWIGEPDSSENRKPTSSLDYYVVIVLYLVPIAFVSIEVHGTSINPLRTCINSDVKHIECIERTVPFLN